MATGFSLCFLRERRTETRVLREVAESLQMQVRVRFDRLEYLMKNPRNNPFPPELPGIHHHRSDTAEAEIPPPTNTPQTHVGLVPLDAGKR